MFQLSGIYYIRKSYYSYSFELHRVSTKRIYDLAARAMAACCPVPLEQQNAAPEFHTTLPAEP